MTDRTPLDAAGVACAIGRTLNWFRRHRADLEARHCFPKPLPGLGLRWDPKAIERWKDGFLPPAQRIEGDNRITLAIDHKSILDARAARLAAGAPVGSKGH